MHFEVHVLVTNQFVAHKPKMTNHNNPCGYFVSHNGNSAGQAGIGGCTFSLFANLAKRNRAEIRRLHSALFWQEQECNIRAHTSFERARNRSYF